jgi:CBS domain-containing protein
MSPTTTASTPTSRGLSASKDFLPSKSLKSKKEDSIYGTPNSQIMQSAPLSPSSPIIFVSNPERAKTRARTRDDHIRRTAELKLSNGLKSKLSAKNSVVSDFMPIDRHHTIFEAGQLMAAKRVDALLVTEGGKPEDALIGILTDKDIVFKCVAAQLDPRQIKVAALMTPNPQTITEGESVSEGLSQMLKGHFRHLPVVSKTCSPEDGLRAKSLLEITLCMNEGLEKLRKRDRMSKQLGIEAHSSLSVQDTLSMDDEEAKLHDLVKMACRVHEQLQAPKLDTVVQPYEQEQDTDLTYNQSVLDAVYWMQKHRQTAALLYSPQDTNELSGIFTTKDVVLRVVAAGLDPKNTSLARVMTPHPDVISSEASILTAFEMMFKHKYLHLPVRFEKLVVGKKGQSSTEVSFALVDVVTLTFKMMDKLHGDLFMPSVQNWLYEGSLGDDALQLDSSPTPQPIRQTGRLSYLSENSFVSHAHEQDNFEDDTLSEYSLRSSTVNRSSSARLEGFNEPLLCKIKVNSKESICLSLNHEFPHKATFAPSRRKNSYPYSALILSNFHICIQCPNFISFPSLLQRSRRRRSSSLTNRSRSLCSLSISSTKFIQFKLSWEIILDGLHR